MPGRLPLTTACAIPVVLLLLLPGAASAAERDATLAGDRLAIDLACVRTVEIQPDSGLHDSIVVHATADHPEELDRLVLEQQDGARVRETPGPCWQPAGNPLKQSTVVLRVRIPSRTPLSVDASGAATYAIGDTGGPLRLDLSGSEILTAGAVGPLQAELSGDGRARIAGVEGDARVELSGSGQVVVGQGQIDRATLEVSGSGGIRIGGSIDTASASVSGSGTIALAHVAGALSRDISGTGSISVGNRPAPGNRPASGAGGEPATSED
ncbi:GIN domain-containing protein [Lichenicola sp.]|uniref:GIN domain-containing protein n=1 Tax=Lichenicola sp. TaxID=2804529 RepID=UPI003B00EB5B